jgi:long-subunit acyl-CoA synthetase (AMP-forming)
MTNITEPLRPRAVVCVKNPWDFLPQLSDYSVMIVNPDGPASRLEYLIDRSDYSLLITKDQEKLRNGGQYREKILCYTGGSTGDSKFYSFTQHQIDLTSKRICQTYDITNNDRYTGIMPLWHLHGLSFYWATQQAGCESNYLSAKEIKSLPKNHPTFISAVPDLLRLLPRLDLTDLRFIRSASARLPNITYTELKEKFNVPVIEAFGMTETLGPCISNPLYGEQRIGTIGLPFGCEARIHHGELQLRGPTMITEGWFDTGDLAEQDSMGYYCLLGRRKEQITIGGVKINPTSMERQILESFPGMTDCVIFGQDRVKCLYIGDADLGQVIEFLTGWGGRPSLVQCVDAIPLSDVGRVSRSFLNSQFN